MQSLIRNVSAADERAMSGCEGQVWPGASAGRVLLSPSELHARQIARPESPAAGVPKCTWLLDDAVAGGRELKRGPTEGPKQTRDLAPAFAALVEVNFEASSTLPSGAPQDPWVLTWKIDFARAPSWGTQGTGL